jgi:biotin carboxylase
MRPVFLMVESNTSGTGALFAQAAKSLGFRPLLMAADISRYPFLQNGDVEVIHVDTANFEALCDAAEEIKRNGHIIGVTTSSEYFLSTAAQLAQTLGLPGASPEHLKNCRNKNWQRNRLSAAGLPVPKHMGASSFEELESAVSSIAPPLIVKPACGTGSIGVRLCSTYEEALRHGRALLEQTVNERGLIVLPEVIIEAYIEGPEYSAEVFGLELIGVTQKHLSAEPYFVETGHDYPADLEATSLKAIEETCLTALGAFGLGWGPAHIEFRMTATGPMVVEVNPRLAGGFIPSLVCLSTGIDLVLQTVSLCSGRRPNLSRTCKLAASIRFMVYPTCGIFLGLEAPGLEAASNVADFRRYHSSPARISIHHDFRDRAGHVIAVGDNVVAASSHADNALNQTVVRMRPAGMEG